VRGAAATCVKTRDDARGLTTWFAPIALETDPRVTAFACTAPTHAPAPTDAPPELCAPFVRVP
jgi:hypothetical protein